MSEHLPEVERPWSMRARWEYALRDSGGTSRVLMRRFCDEAGHAANGDDVAWKDVASFGSYNDAEQVLGLLRKALGYDDSEVPRG